MLYFSQILNISSYLLVRRAVFIWEFSFPLLLSFTYCTYIVYKFIWLFFSCILLYSWYKVSLNLNIKLKHAMTSETNNSMRISLFRRHLCNLVPRGHIPCGQHQGCKTSGIINVKMLANRNLIGYYIIPEVV